jgi:hypothetical protein
MPGYNYFPNYYSGLYQPIPQPVPQMQVPVVQQPVQQPVQATQPEIRQNGFIRVKDEAEVDAYPIAPGNSVTFIHETEPFVFVKTLGFSQFDRPVKEKYRLVKETPEEPNKAVSGADKESASKGVEYAKADELARLARDVEALRVSVKTLNERKTRKVVTEEVVDDE